MSKLTHISLFTGIGGIDLAAEWAGFKTVLFVEIDPYCQKVLKKHWPDVPIIGDIRDVTKEKVMANTESIGGRGKPRDGESQGDTVQIRGQKINAWNQSIGRGNGREEYQGGFSNIQSPITLITGGFPCQLVSQAGKRRGEEDDRWLWPEMLRVVSEVRPTWVVAENVIGLLTMGFYGCLSDLEGEGYETIPFVIPACGVNAPHRRDRIFIVANTRCISSNGGGGQCGEQKKTGPCDRITRPSEYTDNVANTEGIRPRESGRTWQRGTGFKDGSWWAVEPELGRMAYGIPRRVDRLKCLGNAVVPQQIYPILKGIADLELNI